MTTTYRPDIDGLRAIAVLSILLFHLGIEQLSGGFVGVDIFFVISGYLITSIIIREINQGVFTLAGFYERRLRRILPALIIVVLVSVLIGAFLFNASQYVDLGWSAFATALFSSNIFFFLKSGYFDSASELQPLLHTWSLGVEEQFYIFFPIFLLLVCKKSSNAALPWIIGITILSFGASLYFLKDSTEAAFYLFPLRAWELLLGAIIGLNRLPVVKSESIRNLLTITGLGMIFYTIFSIIPKRDFPGLVAAIPTIGTAMIIYAGIGGDSLVSRLLSLKPIVFIGLISYSLYLWHWPLIVYAKLYAITELTLPQSVVVLILVLGLSILTWRYVERPFRSRLFIASRTRIFKLATLGTGSVILLGLSVVAMHGFPKRYDFEVADEKFNRDVEWNVWSNCDRVFSRLNKNQDLCKIGEQNSEARFLLWGDSFAMAYASGIDLAAHNHGISGRVAFQGGCAPLYGIDRRGRDLCTRFDNLVLAYLDQNPQIQTVIISGLWALWATGKPYPHGTGRRLVDLLGSNEQYYGNHVELFDRGLNRTIDTLLERGKEVVLLDQVPEIVTNVASAGFVAAITGRDINKLIGPTLEIVQNRTEKSASIISELENKKPITVLRPGKKLCDSKICIVAVGDKLLYRDKNHLSTFGSKYVASAYEHLFLKLANGDKSSNP